MQNLQEVIFHESKYRNLGQAYVDLFLTNVPNEKVIPIFSIDMGSFRSEYSNKTGEWIKEKILDFIA
jgi:hypothetical protein